MPIIHTFGYHPIIWEAHCSFWWRLFQEYLRFIYMTTCEQISGLLQNIFRDYTFTFKIVASDYTFRPGGSNYREFSHISGK